uniref:Reverse transcriptase RNase H-like domain-containing protein n=1 Tax=Strigamia maritima TaxID=126957 RepID=T1IKP0_STRMM
MRRVGLLPDAHAGLFKCKFLPHLVIPYASENDESQGTKINSLLMNQDIKLDSLDWDEKLVAGSNCTADQKLMLREVLADRFRPYLEYTTFILESDAQALKWLMSTPEPSGRFGCWAVKIQCGAFKILYRQGIQNKIADALSRAQLPVTEIPITDHVEETEVTQFWPDWSGNPSNPVQKISEKSEYFCNVGVKFCPDKSCKDLSKQEGGGEVDEPETLHSALTEILNDIPPTRSDIIEAQRSDPVWKKIRNYLNGSEEV